MISSIALVLGLGKLSSAIYNILESRKVSKDATNTFEKRNVCRKTSKACAWEASTYFAIALIAMLLGE